MVAGIEILPNGIAVFAVSREPAWHVLGDVVAEEQQLAAMMNLSHLGGVRYDKRPAEFTASDGRHIVVPGIFINVRTHPDVGETGVGAVRSRYTNIDVEKLFAWGDDLIADSGAHWESMGSLFDGKQVFGSILLPKHTIGTKYGDEVKVRLTMLNTFDGSGVSRAGVHLERSVCFNTVTANLRAAEAAQQSWKIRHTANALDRLEEARRALGLTFKYISSFEDEMGRLIDQSFTDAEFERIVKDIVIPMPKKIESKETEQRILDRRGELLSLWTAPTQGQFTGTAWGAYNAVVEYLDWFSPIRARDHKKRRAEIQATGVNAGLKGRALAAIKAA